MTITPDDILQSSVFAEDREPEDDERPSSARRACLTTRSSRTLDHPRRRRRLGGRQDDPHPRARPRARRGQRHARLRRRLPPLRPPAARRAEHHAARSRLQLHGHHGPAPRAHARRRAVPEAGLPAQGRHVRPARARRPEAVLGRRGAARLLHRRCCEVSSTCASTWPRPRSSGASGRCSATARAAATRPTRCSGARPARARLGGLHPAAAAHADIVVSFLPRQPATRSTSTRTCCSARRCRIPISPRCVGDEPGGIGDRIDQGRRRDAPAHPRPARARAAPRRSRR